MSQQTPLSKEAAARDLAPLTFLIGNPARRELRLPCGTFRLDCLHDSHSATWLCSFDNEMGFSIQWEAFPLNKAVRSIENFYQTMSNWNWDPDLATVDVLDRESAEITIFRHEAERLLEGYEITEAVRSSPSNDPGDLGKAATENATNFAYLPAGEMAEYWQARNDDIWRAIDRGEFCNRLRDPIRIETGIAPAPCP